MHEPQKHSMRRRKATHKSAWFWCLFTWNFSLIIAVKLLGERGRFPRRIMMNLQFWISLYINCILIYFKKITGWSNRGFQTLYQVIMIHGNKWLSVHFHALVCVTCFILFNEMWIKCSYHFGLSDQERYEGRWGTWKVTWSLSMVSPVTGLAGVVVKLHRLSWLVMPSV